MRKLLLLPLALTLAAVVVPAAEAAPPKTHIVKVIGNSFQPQQIWINEGDSVKWVFYGPGVQRVSKGLTPPQPCRPTQGPDSGLKRPGETFTLKWPEVDEISVYHSTVRGKCNMWGRIHLND